MGATRLLFDFYSNGLFNQLGFLTLGQDHEAITLSDFGLGGNRYF
jgi:hypothetical protein